MSSCLKDESGDWLKVKNQDEDFVHSHLLPWF